MTANLSQILNFKPNFHKGFELFSEKKFIQTMVHTKRMLSLSAEDLIISKSR